MKKPFPIIPTGGILMILLGAALLFSSCKKETGPAGPQGPTGPAGSNGSANISSFTFTTTTNNWTADNTNKLYYYTWSGAAITSQVISSGAVLVYLGDGSGSGWVAMPFTVSGVEFNYAITAGSCEIDVSLSDGTMPNNPGGQQFRIVVIPPGMIKPGVNYKNYSEVQEAHDL